MNDEKEALKLALGQLDELLQSVDLKDVDAESSGFEPLPDGYYLSEVESAELKLSKTSGKPMAALKMKIVNDGIDAEVNSDGSVDFKMLKKTKGRYIFLYFGLGDSSAIRRFASNMLKFEGDTPGEPLLPKEAFISSSTVSEALDLLVGSRAYVQVSTTVNEKTEQSSTWNNLISWKRASMLQLPE